MNNHCKCVFSYEFNSKGVCVDSCWVVDKFSRYNTALEVCKCVSSYGYDTTERKCVLCSTLGDHWVSNSLGQCTCKLNHRYLTTGGTNGTCIPCTDANDPDTNMILTTNNVCMCKNGYYLPAKPNSKCTLCNITYPNTVGDNLGGCVCRAKHVVDPDDGLCYPCEYFDDFAVFYNGACICINNYINDTDSAKPTNLCQPCRFYDNNSIPDGKGGCVCRESYINRTKVGETKGVCRPCNSYDPNSMSNGDNGCICKPNHFPEPALLNAACRPCTFFDINSTADTSNGGCKCRANYFNDTTKSKTCQACAYYDRFSVISADLSKCVCMTNFINKGGFTN